MYVNVLCISTSGAVSMAAFMCIGNYVTIYMFSYTMHSHVLLFV